MPLDDNVFRSIVEESIDAVVAINFDGDIIFWNHAAGHMFGYTEIEVLGKHMHDILPTQNLRPKAKQSFTEFQKTGHGFLVGNFIKATALHKDGHQINIQFGINTTKTKGETITYAFIRDISHIMDMREKQSKLESEVATDELTHILSRRAFIDQSNGAFSMAQRHQEPFSFLMLDIDHFKFVNDEYGHYAGDIVLEKFVQAISIIIRNEDIFGRVGGEEFAITMAKTTKQVAMNIAERIRKEIEIVELDHLDPPYNITVSIGLSSLAKDDKELIDVTKRADDALYIAKKRGRNCVGLL